MNWYNSNPQNNLFPVEATTQGIDLRKEMEIILYGNASVNAKGHWVVIRKFDRTKHSKYYNNISNEGLHGPKHPYVDTVYKTRCIPYPRRQGMVDSFKIGDITKDSFIYYFEWDVPIDHGDQIFELHWGDHRIKPEVDTAIYSTKFCVKRKIVKRCEHGNPSYNVVYAEHDDIKY